MHTPIELIPATGAILAVECPHCGAGPGEPCRKSHPMNVHTRRMYAANRAAAAPAPPAPKFTAAKQDIKQGALTVARAVSKTMAKRIANALNKHVPDRRGQ